MLRSILFAGPLWLAAILALTTVVAAQTCGDCDGDGTVTILDALAGAQHGAGAVLLMGQQLLDCDVDSSGAVTVLDALLVAQAAAGLPVAFTCPSPRGWVQRSPATLPLQRSRPGFAYDESRGVTVMFGGQGPGTVMRDTWEWDGVDWVQHFPATAPSELFSYSMAYDPTLQEVVLTGAFWGIAGNRRETWSWDGTRWLQYAPASGTPERDAPAICFHAGRNRVSLFGGGSMSGVQDTSVDFDGTDWTTIGFAGAKPVARQGAAMVWDRARSQVFLFGGTDFVMTYGDTWTEVGGVWTNITQVTGPSPRQRHAMVFDADRNVTFLFGGRDGFGAPVPNTTWEHDGVGWSQMSSTPAPIARYAPGMAYDSQRRRIVLFGGRDGAGLLLGDTWEY